MNFTDTKLNRCQAPLRLLYSLVIILLLSSFSVGADEQLEFTDPQCCVLKDIKLSNEMDVAPSLFPNSAYPSQHESFDPNFVGEFRGTYGNNWRPKQSQFGQTRGKRFHGGIDVYAPSYPKPMRTPIIAVVDGELIYKKDNGGDIGNRVWLSFDFQGEPYRFIYGHLSEFEGTDRKVNVGAIIGYSGCSGNADSDGTCSLANICGLTSGHVHLQLVNDGNGKRYDPIRALRWNLKYREGIPADPCTDLN